MICFSKWKWRIDKLTPNLPVCQRPGCQEALDHQRQQTLSHLWSSPTARRHLSVSFSIPVKRPVRREGWKRTRSRSSHSPTSSRPALLPPCTDYCTVCQRYSHWPRTIISSRRHINSTQVVLKSPSWSFNLYTVSSVHFRAAISVPLTYRSLTCALPGPSSDVKVSFLALAEKAIEVHFSQITRPHQEWRSCKVCIGQCPNTHCCQWESLLCWPVDPTSHVPRGPVSPTLCSIALCHHQVMRILRCVSLRVDLISLIFLISHLRFHIFSFAQSSTSCAGFRRGLSVAWQQPACRESRMGRATPVLACARSIFLLV